MLQFMGLQRVGYSLATEQQFLFQSFSFICKSSCLIYGISLSLNVYILILLTGQICWQLISSTFACLKKFFISYSLLKDTSLTIDVHLCKRIDFSTPGFPVHQQLLELAQTHATKPFHPLSFPSPPAFSVSQHQCLF